MDGIETQRLVTDAATPPQRFAKGTLAGGLVLLGLFTLRGFLPALAWAGVFAIALWPLYSRVQSQKGGGRNILIPTLFTLAVALIFLVPLGLVGLQLGRETHAGVEWARGALQNGIPVPEQLSTAPFGSQAAVWWNDNLADPEAARALLRRLNRSDMVDFGRNFGLQVLRRSTLFFFTLLALFFLFRDGLSLSEQMRHVSRRAFGPSGERIMLQMATSIHGTVDGLVLVGLGEGVLLGVVYYFAGVPHATIFGALTAVAAMIPFAAPVVFIVAALLLFAQGSTVAAIVVVAAGFATTFIADHAIRPVLIGGATKLPFLWVLLGILGGVEVWGLLGLFVGPAIMAALILLWREWSDPKKA
jgi:predicted PurR-regulated permease PerM